MQFIQIIDVHTDHFESIDALDREWEAATEGRRTIKRSVVTRDRNDATHYVILAVFDSYESAMENSNLPETSTLAAKLGELTTDSRFIDLEVIDDRTFA